MVLEMFISVMLCAGKCLYISFSYKKKRIELYISSWCSTGQPYIESATTLSDSLYGRHDWDIYRTTTLTAYTTDRTSSISLGLEKSSQSWQNGSILFMKLWLKYIYIYISESTVVLSM